jgi:REP element-mobilizing transposase RayT
MAPDVWNLRSERSFTVIHGALDGVRARPGFRVVHFAILGNHVHAICEADGPRALANGVRALSIRLARRLNRAMGRSGPVLEDRYHARVLRTPAEVDNVVQYVLGNHRRHARAWGEKISARWVDPYTSERPRSPQLGQLSLWEIPVTRRAGTWLLRRAGRRGEVASRGGAHTPLNARGRTGEQLLKGRMWSEDPEALALGMLSR